MYELLIMLTTPDICNIVWLVKFCYYQITTSTHLLCWNVFDRLYLPKRFVQDVHLKRKHSVQVKTSEVDFPALLYAFVCLSERYIHSTGTVQDRPIWMLAYSNFVSY